MSRRDARETVPTTGQAPIPSQPSLRQVIVWVIGIVAILVVLIAVLIWATDLGLLSPENAGAIGASIGALIALCGVLITQVFNTKIARSGQIHAQQLANQSAQEAALQNYLERMGELLIKEDLRTPQHEYPSQSVFGKVQTSLASLLLEAPSIGE